MQNASQENLKKTAKNKRLNLDDTSNAILALSIFIVAWEAVFLTRIWSTISLPSPVMVAESFVKITLDGSLPYGTLITLARLVGSFAISLVLGTAIGLTMTRFKGFGRTMDSFSAGLLSFPSIAWVPFSILLIGFSDFGIMFVVIMSSVFSIMITVYSSIRNIPSIYLDAAKNLGAKKLILFTDVIIPAATPSLISGLRQGWSFAWHAIIGAEILMSIVGLGHILSVGRDFLDMSQVIASMITIFTIGLIVDRFLLRRIEDNVRRKWGLEHHR